MPYTVWSNDRLVGETELNYIANTSQVKFGDFTATDFGKEVISLRMAPRQAVCARVPYDEVEKLHKQRDSIPLELRAPDGHVIPTDDIEITDLEWLLTLAPLNLVDEDWQSDVELADFELMEELDPEPPTIHDNLIPEELLEQETGAQLFDEFDVPEIELGESEQPPPNFPRYQIQVRITNGG